MKYLFLALMTVATTLAKAPSDHLGLQLWSLRAQFQKNVPTTLDLVHQYGFTIVETAGTYGLDPAAFRAQMDARGIKVVSAHFGYNLLDGDLKSVISQAKALGADYVVVPVIPHHPLHFDLGDARKAAENFNTWGAALKANGLKLAYHTHGYEFEKDPATGKTPFDVLLELTRPDLVTFEMDVFWVTHAGADPVALLNKYPDRWRMLHLKDLRAGAPKNESGAAPATDDVPVGSGEIAWPSVFDAAKKAGVVYYFIEDESVSPVENIPISLRYLDRFGL